jgi:ABC-type dipeptide/oligopeptide/nickel transport system permease component/ABC-type dipeptide/oligopeptide/nickel transport system permease subunit
MNNSGSNETLASSKAEVGPSSSIRSQDRVAAWIQFPRRVLLLLIAFGLISLFLFLVRAPMLGSLSQSPGGMREPEWGVSWTSGTPVNDVIAERLPNTLLLLGAALFLALLLATVATLIAVLIHKLEEKSGPLGSILKALGRLGMFTQAAMPVFVLGLFLIIVFAIKLKVLPAMGLFDVGNPDDFGSRLRHLILPMLTLAIFPALLTAQATARVLTLPVEQTMGRRLLTGLFKLLAVWMGQIGGLLSGLVLVETIFAWPGIGRMLFEFAVRSDLPVLFGVLGVLVLLTLVGRLVAELFHWLARLVSGTQSPLENPPTPWRKTARKVWVIASLVLLLIPLGFALAGLGGSQEASLTMDAGSRLSPPSAEHPWGTDQMGRDLQARVLRGGTITIGMTIFAAVILLIPSVLGGGLAGFLTSRRTWWAESLADLLLLPADALGLIPVVPAALLLSLLLKSPDNQGAVWLVMCFVVVLVLLPRTVRVYRTLWVSASARYSWLRSASIGLAALFLSSLFAGFGLITSLDFLGYGTPPPTPTLGSILGGMEQYLAIMPSSIISAGVAIWICALVFYTAADAIAGFFNSKEMMAQLNE